MEQVDKILTGGMLLTMNESMDLFPDGAVAVRGDSIVAVGPATVIEIWQCDRHLTLGKNNAQVSTMLIRNCPATTTRSSATGTLPPRS